MVKLITGIKCGQRLLSKWSISIDFSQMQLFCHASETTIKFSTIKSLVIKNSKKHTIKTYTSCGLVNLLPRQIKSTQKKSMFLKLSSMAAITDMIWTYLIRIIKFLSWVLTPFISMWEIERIRKKLGASSIGWNSNLKLQVLTESLSLSCIYSLVSSMESIILRSFGRMTSSKSLMAFWWDILIK